MQQLQRIELPPSLFVPTNAGVMHALDAKTGHELAAFMPRQSLRHMLNYANTDYSFEYTLDGPLSEHDIYYNSRWNHLAMGTGGRGEQLLYAVRSPLNEETTPNRTPKKDDFVWETGPAAINNKDVTIGYMTNPMRSGQSEHGEWIAVVNSGHLNGHADGSRHGLVVLNAITGATIRTIPLPSTYSTGDSSTGRTNGLGGITLVRDVNQRIVAAYAGDANGNLWRFDLRGAPANWGVSYNKPLFTTANHRPIYGSPAWQAHPGGGTIVVVATGILLSDKDLEPTVLKVKTPAGVLDTIVNEAIYGIWDPTPIGKEGVADFKTVTQAELLQQTVLEDTASMVDNNTFYRASKNAIDWTKHRGWTLPLARSEKYKGERSLDQIRNVGRAVLIATTVITARNETDEESCSAAALPPNFLYTLNALDGSSTRMISFTSEGKTAYASVVLMGAGGYSRGLALVRTTPSATSSDRRYRGVDTLNGEGRAGSGVACRSENWKPDGTEGRGPPLGASCPGWTRAQYQLSHPPAN